MKSFLEQPMVIAFGKNFPEAILAGATTLYGLWITFPPDSLQYAQGYELLAAYMPFWVWGAMFFIVGVTNLWGVLRRRGDLVRFTSRILSLMWFFVAFMFGWAALFSPGWILILTMAVLYAGVGTEYRTKTKWHDATDDLGPDM